MALDVVTITGTHCGKKCRVKFTRRLDKPGRYGRVRNGWKAMVTVEGKTVERIVDNDSGPRMATAETLCDQIIKGE